MQWFDAARARLRLLFGRDASESRIAREFAFHIEMETARLRDLGLAPAEARRQALASFGGVEGHKEALRAGGGHVTMRLGWSWLDLKLAFRMLVRSRVMSAIGVLGMAIGIAIAAGAFVVATAIVDPTLPLDEGDRVVSIMNWDVSSNTREQRVLHELARWRESAAFSEIGAARDVSRTLRTADGQATTVTAAEMTASGFSLVRVAPRLGRYLLPEDERRDAANVAVIGYGLWQRRFAADPAIVGREVRLGSTAHTIVGVMPEGFGFPINHDLWVPWRLDPSLYPPRSGSPINVFARLAPGESATAAQEQLAAQTTRLAGASPATHAHLRVRVRPYAYGYTDMDDRGEWLGVRLMQSAVLLLLVVVCVNVAVLVYARTATRQAEIAVRTALGASRGRIVSQLFLEALVLAAVAAAIGLGLVHVGLRWLTEALLPLLGSLPFWMNFNLSTASAVYIGGLAVLAAAIVGIVPALQATGRRVMGRLQALSSGSISNLRIGRVWTALIVVQVAIAVAVLPTSIYFAWESLRFRAGDLGFATREFVGASVAVEGAAMGVSRGQDEAIRSRFGVRQAELESRIESEGAVAGVSFSMENPGGEWAAVIEADGVALPPDPVNYNIVEGSKRGHLARFNRVAPDFFPLYDVSVLTGRGFEAADALPGADRVLVDRTFAERLFGRDSPLGRRVRYVGRSREAREGSVTLDRWYEIVGVVADFPPFGDADRLPHVYHAVAPGDLYPAQMTVRVRGDASAFVPRLRDLAAGLDPRLELRDLQAVEDALRQEQQMMRLIGVTIMAAMLSVIALAGAGIYALMAFTVAQRGREIGIRVALGARPSRLLTGIFARVLRQLALGVGAGAIVSAPVIAAAGVRPESVAWIALAVAAILAVVGLLAAVGPARRSLRVDAAVALRSE